MIHDINEYIIVKCSFCIQLAKCEGGFRVDFGSNHVSRRYLLSIIPYLVALLDFIELIEVLLFNFFLGSIRGNIDSFLTVS